MYPTMSLRSAFMTRAAVFLPRRVRNALAVAAPAPLVPQNPESKAYAASAGDVPPAAASSEVGAGAASYVGRERMLAYGNAGKAEKIRRRLAILEEEVSSRITDFDQAVKKGSERSQDLYYSLWKSVDEKIQLLQADPEKYEREHGL